MLLPISSTLVLGNLLLRSSSAGPGWLNAGVCCSFFPLERVIVNCFM